MARTASCNHCGIELPKSELHQFDSTFSGEFPSGEKLELCTNCMLSRYRNSLRAFSGRAIVIQPLPPSPTKGFLQRLFTAPYNAYQFYPLSRMLLPKYNFTREWVDGISSYLPPPDATCEECGRPARFNWCSPEIYYSNPFEELNLTGDFPQTFLCADCLATQFSETVIREKLFFLDIQPPVESDGMCTSWQV